VSVTDIRIDTLAKQSATGLGDQAQLSLVELYHKYFQYRLVHDAQDYRDAYALRYAVYCEETGYLSKQDNPNGLERDASDSHSLHSILIHTDSNRVAGTVRVVLPRRNLPGCAQPARQFSQILDALPESVLPRMSTGEISRFAIHPSFRRRLGDGLYASIFNSGQNLDQDFDPRRVIPHITLGLFASMFEMKCKAGLTHFCAVIDPALLRLLTRLGLHFHKAGPTIEYHGARQPVYVEIAELIDRVEREQPEIHQLIVSSYHQS
jgi:N-acyl amino acid synthase of PEP-CTERM/exosortase system